MNWFIRVISRLAERLKALGLRRLGNIRKISSQNYCLVFCPSEMKLKISWKKKKWTFSVLCYFTWKLEFLSNISWMIVARNSLFLPRPLQIWHTFNLKLEQLICKKHLLYLITTFPISSLRSKFDFENLSSLV